MPLRPDMEMQDYLELFLRRKWFIIFSFLFILFGASVYSVVVPEQFKSTTTILIIPQRVPENYVQSTVSIGVADRLATIQQQVMSRTRLMQVMEELNLFPDDRGKKPPEELLEAMRKRIEIDVVSDKGRRRDQGTDAFSISFFYENPKLAMLTASRLASLFIDENLKTREQQAVGTSEFLDSQLQETKERLEAQEEKIKQYKLRFMGELPQELQTNLAVLSRLQDQYKTNADAIRAAEDRKVFLEAQLSMLERSVQTVVQEDGRVQPLPGLDPLQSLMAELTLKRSRLADLSTKYTEQYPEVTRMRHEVEQLEAKLAQLKKNPPAMANQGIRISGSPVPSPPPLISTRDLEEIRRIKAQVASTTSEIGSLKQAREAIQKNISELQAKIERSPRREQEMISLTRDYDNLKQSYNDLLKKKLEADISQNLEKRQKGEQFQIIDPANYPEKPFKPDRKKVFGIALLLAFGLGFGGVIGLEMIDPTLRAPRDFKHYFDLPVLAAIPVLQDASFRRKKKILQATVFGGIICFAVAVSAFLLIYAQRIRIILKF
ncbi:MAG: hypothetical protein Kow00128_12010 [Deltaproteobacteria bacterium]